MFVEINGLSDNNCKVYEPDADNEIEIETHHECCGETSLYFKKEDLEKMLSYFDKPIYNKGVA